MESLKAKSLLEQSIHNFENKNLDEAMVLARKGEDSLIRTKDYLAQIRTLPSLSIIEKGKAAYTNGIEAGVITSKAIQNLLTLGEDFIAMSKKEDENFNSLTPGQKTKILISLQNAAPRLLGIKAELELASYSLDQIPKNKYLYGFNYKIRELKIKIGQIQQIIDRAIPVCNTLPNLLGLSNEKTYLLLLQNNTELRPTGGFLGTYSIVKLKNGSIEHFQTDNVYNLDEPNKEKLHIIPPWPLKKYNAVNDWFMRDANWSPDWPTSAEKIEWFYHEEGGVEKKIDGIIAIDPDFLIPLLKITGPIKVEDVEFNQKNFVYELEYQVEKGYLRQGLNLNDRKEIIGVLGQELLSHIYELPIKEWPDLWQTVKNSIDEKHVLAYFKNQDLQQEVVAQNWGGEVKMTDHDYIMVIDANLASLKTDSVMERGVHYKLTESADGQLIAKVIITYQNNGGFTWLTTRYGTYTRVYVPKGSELINTIGSMQDRHTNIAGQTQITEELDKTVFGAFISVEPGELRQLIFEYKLPERIKRHYKNGIYQLIIQKQAGTTGHKLNLDLSLKKEVKSASTELPAKQTQKGLIKAEGDLRTDRRIQLNF